MDKIEKHIEVSRELKRWKLTSVNHKKIDKVVIIPALAEKDYLFKTLLSLSKNNKQDLNSTVIICVINNRPKGFVTAEEKQNNEITLKCLDHLLYDSPLDFRVDQSMIAQLEEISDAGLKIAYVDASTNGLELSSKGGVGLARKIGMDYALTLFENRSDPNNLLISLDADTTVQPNYLSEICGFFSGRENKSAVISYCHQLPNDEQLSMSISAYELFLRYYVAGLKYANSPYTFHTIGSTIVCTSSAYVSIGGMNRKVAAEDFYFLQKLAKQSPVGEISTTTVYPSSRISGRVPFGTGRKMDEMISDCNNKFPFYNPKIFSILKKFLLLFSNSDSLNKTSGNDIMQLSRTIDPLLYQYLMNNDFLGIWEKLKKNNNSESGLFKSFHIWFDAFRTMKCIKYLTENGYNGVDMYLAIRTISEMDGSINKMDFTDFYNGSTDNLKRRLSLLDSMRDFGGRGQICFQGTSD